jgi:DNA-binding transcriptional LysR family regulator
MGMNIVRNGPSFDRGSLVVAAAAQGLGVALETLRFAEDEIKNGSLVRLGGDKYAGIKRDLHYLCFRTRDQNTLKIKSFCDWILAQAETQ